MAVGKEIKKKIGSVQNTQKITSAMQMVAASKMRRTQDRMLRDEPEAPALAYESFNFKFLPKSLTVEGVTFRGAKVFQ